jgi:hypothetical protein
MVFYWFRFVYISAQELLGYGVLLILLVINLRGGCKPNKALVGVGS